MSATATAPATIDITVERTITAPPERVYDAWLTPGTPGTIWAAAEKFLLDAKVDGLFWWTIRGNAHYGRFTAMERGARLEHTWMSNNTAGLETMVEVTFAPRGGHTLMTLVHRGLPDTNQGRGHEKGWTFFLEGVQAHFASEANA